MSNQMLISLENTISEIQKSISEHGNTKERTIALIEYQNEYDVECDRYFGMGKYKTR